MENLFNLCKKYLKITKPVVIKMSDLYLKYRATHTYWVNTKGDIKRHVINIAICEDGRNINTIIAHEFVHAWQAEHNPKSETHGKEFAKKARLLRKYLNRRGFDIQSEIFDKSIDK